MKVLLINKYYFLRGGAERVFFDTKKVLEENGHEVCIFAMKHSENLKSRYSKYFVDEVQFQTIGGVIKAYKNVYSFKQQKLLEQLIREQEPDIVHIHNGYFQISPSIFKVLRKYNLPVLYTSHDYHLICPNYQLFTQGEVCEKCKIHKYHQAIVNRCQNNSLLKSIGIAGVMTFNKIFQLYECGIDHVFAPSEFMRQKLIDWEFKPAEEISVLNNAVDLKIFSTRAAAKSRKYMLYVGRFSKEKGLLVLLKALKKNPDIPFRFVGDGPMKAILQRLAKKLPNVEVVSYQKSQKGVVEQLKGAQALILPTLSYESYGMSAVEALACKTPVIAAKTGGIPEIVQNGKTGYLFAVGDDQELAIKMRKLYNNYEKIDELGKNGRKFVEKNNSHEKYYKKLIKEYNNFL